MKIAAAISCFLAAMMALYFLFILRPQVRESERKLNLPEFQGTAHRQTIQCAFRKLQWACVRTQVLMLILGLVGLWLFLIS